MNKFPLIEVNLTKLEHNVRVIKKLCDNYNVEFVGVTKAVSGDIEIVKAYERGGVSQLGDSRIKNILELKNAGASLNFILIRTPMLSEVGEVVKNVSISFNSEFEIIEALSKESILQNKTHKIIIMVETGDLREGVMPEDVLPLVKRVGKLRGVELIGLGTNLACLCGVIPDEKNLSILEKLKKEIFIQESIDLEILSGANSSSISDLIYGKFPKWINQIRIGEGILLGRETINRDIIPETFQDVFILRAEIIEMKMKPSLPNGDTNQNAFGKVVKYFDKGKQLRGIVALGKLDVNTSSITPVDKSILIIDANSDHLVLDLSQVNRNEYKVGSHIDFSMQYSALISAMTSNYIIKEYIK